MFRIVDWKRSLLRPRGIYLLFGFLPIALVLHTIGVVVLPVIPRFETALSSAADGLVPEQDYSAPTVLSFTVHLPLIMRNHTIRLVTATPTPTAVPTPRPSPSWCRSFRPPLPDSGHPGEFEIGTPANCVDDLPHRVTIGGTYTGILEEDEENLEVWGLVYPSDNRYYPQSSDACGESPADFGGGVWIVTGYLGREGVPETFDIVVVVTSKQSEASTRFKQYLREGCNTGTFLGIPRSAMPTDLAEKASITVRTDGKTHTSTPTLTSTPTAGGPTPAPTQCDGEIEFTYVPPYGSFDDLQGQVRCVQPAGYQVAVYIFVSGWWNKPYWASSLTTIEGDGSWTCDITTGGTDQLATKIAAFLVPNGYNPPLMRGDQSLPEELFENSVAWVVAEREAVYRTIEFSGYTWRVKASETPAGPGPNYFSDRVDDVWVDDDGRLHLRIVHKGGKWYCTEVFTETPLGYGKYVFYLASRVDQLDKNIVLGLFTWDDTAPEYSYREVDIEFAKWGQEANENAQYVIQPWHHIGNMYRFDMGVCEEDSTHGFDWRTDRVFFQSLPGHQPFPGPAEDEIASWTYTGDDIPPAGEGNARINLWLIDGNPPSDGEAVELIIEAFEFVPQTK